MAKKNFGAIQKIINFLGNVKIVCNYSVLLKGFVGTEMN
jgi:hypothetical protein